MVTTYLDAIRPARPLADGETQTQEGGIAFAADDWTRLRRFLVLGSDGGTFYAGAHELTVENVGVVRRCLDADGKRAVEAVASISLAGRAPKNEPAILALAMASIHPDAGTRGIALAYLPAVCRTGTHLLHFAKYREALGGGWGRGTKRAVGNWFNAKPARDLAYQAVKYTQRDGWALADLLRLAHPKPASAEHDVVMKYVVDRELPPDGAWEDEPAVGFLRAAEWARAGAGGSDAVAAGVRAWRLPRESVASEFLNDPAVWDALLADMPTTAMVRNLGKMSAVGLLTPGSDAERAVVDRLGDGDRLRTARVHPIALLAALKVYEQGTGERGSLSWSASKRVVTALDEAFYLAFAAVEPTGKRIRLALDVSASMDGSTVNGMPFLSAREASAALALVTLATERDAHVVAYSHKLVGVNLRPSMRLDEVIRTLSAIPFGGTFCSLPIQQATESGAEIDAFFSFTDSETWNGGARGFAPAWMGQPPSQTASEALAEYRRRSGIPARHAVVAMAANDVSIADPRDPGQLDVAGFDAATPAVLADFARGAV